MRKVFLFVGALYSVFSVMAQRYETIVAPLNDEKWWGGLVALGSRMPFASTTEWYDLGKVNLNNQIVPLLLSSEGRYVWSEQPFCFRLQNDTLILRSDYIELNAVSAGTTLKDAYLAASAVYFPPSGNIPTDLFFSKPQYNTWIELMYNQNHADIEKYAWDILTNGFPTGIFMIDDNWQKYYGNFEFKPDKFPDPAGMITRLHEQGFKVMLWICPFVSPDSPEFRLLAKKGYLVKKKNNNSPAMINWWNGVSACYDMTNPEVVSYLEGQLRDVQKKYGVDGFKFDAGDVVHFTGEYTFHDPVANACTFSQKWAELGLKFSYNEYRTSFKLGGQALVQRLGDKSYSWNSSSLLIPDMIAAGLLGHAYTCPDMIGGGEFNSFLNIDTGNFDQELIVRSCQIHALMPMMQFSVAPWRILDKKHLDICCKFAGFHEQMGEYILKTAVHASQTGEPTVRHLEYSFPHQGFEECHDQFMLGDKYLIAPMVVKGTHRKVKLPKGVWRDDMGKKIRGPKVIEIGVPLERLPYFERIK